jgi:hypothetical protein
VEFVDIGEQSVKNIPVLIHAYTLSLGAEDPRSPKAPPQKKAARSAIWPIAITAASVATLGGIGFAYQTVTRSNAPIAAIAPQAALTVEPSVRAAPAQSQSEKQALRAVPLAPDRPDPPPRIGLDPPRDSSDPQHAPTASEHPSVVDIKAPCVQIRMACEQAGFAYGGVREGSGLQVDCIRPIMRGIPRPPWARRPLPQVDPQIVEACRARNASFGEMPLQPLQRGPWQMLARPMGRMRY